MALSTADHISRPYPTIFIQMKDQLNYHRPWEVQHLYFNVHHVTKKRRKLG